MSSPPAGPSTFSLYASRFLQARSQPQPPTQPIFHSAYDPFLSSPDDATPHLAGSDDTLSPNRTPPYIQGLRVVDMTDDETNLDSQEEVEQPSPICRTTRVSQNNMDPYTASESDEEMDLDEILSLRQSANPAPLSDRAKKGWLAHQSVFPTSSSGSSSRSDEDTESLSGSVAGVQDDAPYDLRAPLLDDDATHINVPPRLPSYHGQIGHWDSAGLQRYKALWLSSLIATLISLFFVWGATESPDGARTAPTLLPLLPLLLTLVIPALLFPIVFIYFLQKTVRPVLIANAIFIPFLLFVCGWWALGESFQRIEGDGRWWATTGLRLGTLFLWTASACAARLMWSRRRRLERAAAVVQLSTRLLLAYPPLLLLVPTLLAIFTVMSIPYLTLILRLGTIGYWRHPQANTYIYHIRPYAGWLILLVSSGWMWTWGVLRGITRVTVAGVIGNWCFHRNVAPALSPTEITIASLHRATGNSLGSICLGAGIVAVIRIIGRSAEQLRHVTKRSLPPAISFLSAFTPLLTILASVLDQVNGYALIYVGITGDAFWPSARKAVGLAHRRNAGRLLDYTFVKLLLTLSAITLSLITATAGYLFMALSLHDPRNSLYAAVLCGIVPFLIVRAGVSILGDAADALFVCHQIDHEVGANHCEDVIEAFTGDNKLVNPV